MKKILSGILALTCLSANTFAQDSPTLKEAYANDFLVGVAVSHSFIEQNNTPCLNLIREQFSAVSPEDVMKPETIHPAPSVWNFKKGDEYCKFANDNGLKALGHTLMWHNQTPDFFWLNEDGSVRTKEEMEATLVEYIEKTATHFAGKVYAWDVVNEIISEEGGYRNDKGWEKYYPGNLDDLVAMAFQTAHRCDPNAELYYNDYNMWRQTKVDGVVRMVKMLQSRGIRIDGVGIQAHWGLNYPSISDVETTIDRLHALGVKVMITEFDIDMLPFSKEGQMTGKAMYDPALQREEFMRYLNPYATGLPAEVDKDIADRYELLMRTIWSKRDKISRVTFWGLHDGVSWKNNYPIPNRTNYPLLFDRQLHKKPAFNRILNIPSNYKLVGEIDMQNKASFKNGAKARKVGGEVVVDLGSKNGYYDLTPEMGQKIMALNDYTFSMYYKVNSKNKLDGYGHFAFACSALAENSADEGPYVAFRLNEQRFEVSTGGYAHEELIMTGTPAVKDKWVHVVYRQKGHTGELYIDGKLIGTNSNMPFLSEIFKEAPANCWIGRAPFKGDKFLTDTMVRDLRIYNYALTDGELSALK